MELIRINSKLKKRDIRIRKSAMNEEVVRYIYVVIDGGLGVTPRLERLMRGGITPLGLNLEPK